MKIDSKSFWNVTKHKNFGILTNISYIHEEIKIILNFTNDTYYSSQLSRLPPRNVRLRCSETSNLAVVLHGRDTYKSRDPNEKPNLRVSMNRLWEALEIENCVISAS
jgi:hypothetical protein